VTLDDFTETWRTNAMGAFLAVRQVIPAMRQIGKGNIIFIGATASRRGVAGTAAFASAKAAQRSLADSLARNLEPTGIHVSLIIIDGVVDGLQMRTQMPDKPDSYFVQPDDVADIALSLTHQKPLASTFELEARPFGEKW
jgi:NAD(P)-dependent dehydrogenase (short-subunit alcohol dehydrogenase family)